jgi:hypothetical protein
MNVLTPQEADMTLCTRGKLSNWLAYWSSATVIRNTVPPRDPDDDDEDENEEDDEQDEEPAVIREPDE